MNAMPSQPQTGIDRPALAWGAFLIALGVIVGGLQLGLLEPAQIGRLWPLAPMAFGLTRVVAANDARDRRTGVWFVLVGSWLLLNAVGTFGLHWSNSWPLIVLGGGVLGIVWPTPDEDRWDGFVWAVAGAWMLCITQGWLGLGWRNSWPLLLLFVGLGMFGKALVQAARSLAAGRS